MDTRLTEIKAELAALDSQRLVSAPLNETLAQFGPLWVEDPACGEALTECEWTRLVGSLISSAAYDAESGEVGVELRDTNISPV